MASTECGYCGRLAHMTAASGLHLIGDESGGGTTKQAVYKCPSCLKLNVATQWSDADSRGTVVYGMGDATESEVWVTPSWLPRREDSREFPNVPEHIGQAATEATLCLSVNAFRAVGAMARAVIEATAKEKGVTKGTLESKIDALLEAGHVRKHTADQAHEIRHFGNDMAHGDFIDPVTKDEAEDVIALMSEVLDEVYQSPARLEKRRAARDARKVDGV